MRTSPVGRARATAMTRATPGIDRAMNRRRIALAAPVEAREPRMREPLLGRGRRIEEHIALLAHVRIDRASAPSTVMPGTRRTSNPAVASGSIALRCPPAPP